jgi:hypothetical protein
MKQAMEIMIWQGNGFACCGMRKAGARHDVQATRYPTIEAARADMDAKLAKHGVVAEWTACEQLTDTHSYGGFIGRFER